MILRTVYSRLAVVLLALLPSLLTPWSAHAENSDANDAKAMLAAAVELFNDKGHVAALCAINSNKASFVKGELYVFVIDLKGTVFAHSAAPYLLGWSYKDVVDAEGTDVGKNIIDLATSKGEGSVEYVWTNYKTKKVEKKQTFIKMIDEVNFIVGAGYYSPKKKAQ